MNGTTPQKSQIYEISLSALIQILNNLISGGNICSIRKLQQIVIRYFGTIPQSSCKSTREQLNFFFNKMCLRLSHPQVTLKASKPWIILENITRNLSQFKWSNSSKTATQVFNNDYLNKFLGFIHLVRMPKIPKF